MAALVRLRARWNSRVKVPDLADTVRPVTESNCIGATPPGGEQLEVNHQSVTGSVRMDGQSELDSVGGSGEPASTRRSPNKIVRPANPVDLRRGGGDAIHAVPFEVRVPERRADEADARREGSDQLVEVEGDFLQPPAVAGELAHVTCLAPAALRLPVLLVAAVGVETATGDDDI